MPGQARLSVRQTPLVHGRFSFQDEAGGSSPPRPTTGSNQRKRHSAHLECAGVGGYRTKNAYLVTTPRHDQDAQRLLSVVFGPLGWRSRWTSCGRELAPSLRWMLPRWNPTVSGLRNSGAAATW